MSLADKTVLIVGCGGLGCNVVEYLGRAGIGRLIILDGDVFEESNLNRQLYCDKSTLGRAKVEVASEQLALISKAEVIAIKERFPTIKLDKYRELIDVVVDCLDNVDSRLLLEKFATEINVPLVHGAICGRIGQATTVFPSDGTLMKLYNNKATKIIPTMAFVPSLIASIEAAEVVNVLNNKSSLHGSLLLIDLDNITFTKVKL